MQTYHAKEIFFCFSCNGGMSLIKMYYVDYAQSGGKCPNCGGQLCVAPIAPDRAAIRLEDDPAKKWAMTQERFKGEQSEQTAKIRENGDAKTI